MKVTSGALLIGTGLLHTAIGVAVGLGATDELGGHNLFAEVAHHGVVSSIAPDPVRMAMFWFLFFGFALLVLGDLVRHLDRAGVALPPSLGWQLVALGLAGGVMIPASGFWLVVPQGWWITQRARRSMKARAPDHRAMAQ